MPFAELTDVRCHYELLGTGDPLLLIPGLGATCDLWSCVTPELSRSFSLILIDNREMGGSIAKRPPQTLADYAVDAVELLDYLHLDRAHVMGLSLGGIIAQQLASDHPSRVDRLVLMSCTNRFGPYLREIAKLLGQALRHFPPDVFRRMVELLGTAPEYVDAHFNEMEQRLAAAGQIQVPRTALIHQLRCLGCRDVEGTPDYHVTRPTLVIAGEQDMLIPACYGRRMADDIPGSEFLLVPQCGHDPLIEKPEFVMPRILDFLSRPSPDQTGDMGQFVLEESI
jgi:pimeloyl-ACP methyl ester carboxylesterase